MTVIDVKAIRHGLREEDLEHSGELAQRYMNVAKLEMVVQDAMAERAKEVILKTARTGRKGDGLIYISQIDETVHIRTGAHQRDVLRNARLEPFSESLAKGSQ